MYIIEVFLHRPPLDHIITASLGVVTVTKRTVLGKVNILPTIYILAVTK